MAIEKKKMSLVFSGEFEYPRGMAGTKRVQHAIDGLRAYPGTSIHVLILRQSSRNNELAGLHRGIPYETVMGDLFRGRTVVMLPLLYLKSRRILRRLFDPHRQNILYFYGTPDFDNLLTLRYARKIGFKVVFDLVEDFDLAMGTTRRHRIRIAYIRMMLRRIASLADGIIVISSHLEKKYNRLVSGKVPIHKMPISIDMGRYSAPRQEFGSPVVMFYSGSFGKKDGINVLLDAFERLASKGTNVSLVLTGIGTAEAMRDFTDRVDASPFRDRIFYKGYLDEEAYYRELNDADILCMTRIDDPYAHAGFPFKLGEFMATGKPVIASAVSDISDLFEDRQHLVLVRPGDSDAIVEAAEALISDPKEAFAIGSAGRAIAKRLFDYGGLGGELHNFLSAMALKA